MALVLLLTGCGGTATKSDGPGKATVACRGQWKDLGKQVRGNDRAARRARKREERMRNWDEFGCDVWNWDE